MREQLAPQPSKLHAKTTLLSPEKLPVVNRLCVQHDKAPWAQKTPMSWSESRVLLSQTLPAAGEIHPLPARTNQP